MQSSKTTECHNNEISIYQDPVATQSELKSEFKKLIAAFPEVDNDYIIVLTSRLVEKRFTKQRVQDAINNIIDTCPYRRPSIADIISFDKKVRIYDYSEVEKMCSPGRSAFEKFERVNINGKWKYLEK
jgi:hypothetical protein